MKFQGGGGLNFFWVLHTDSTISNKGLKFAGQEINSTFKIWSYQGERGIPLLPTYGGKQTRIVAADLHTIMEIYCKGRKFGPSLRIIDPPYFKLLSVKKKSMFMCAGHHMHCALTESKEGRKRRSECEVDMVPCAYQDRF